MIRVGTSGWSYDDWDATFYPADLPRARWGEHYRTRFSTVEINLTFYRLPRPTTVQKWHDEAPPRFRYAVKGSRYITHVLRLGDGAQEAVGTFVRRVAPLKSYLSVVLWQLPPNLHRDDGRLEHFLRALPRRVGSTSLRHAIEFRHRSWVDDDVFALLDRHRATHVWVSSQAMPPNRTRTGDLVYVRFHGLDGGYRHDYTDAELAPWAEALADAGCDGYVFFNNDGDARAPANAQRLRAMLGRHAFPWPRPGRGGPTR